MGNEQMDAKQETQRDESVNSTLPEIDVVRLDDEGLLLTCKTY